MSLPPPHTFKKDATCLNLPLIDTIFLFFLIYQSPFPFTTIENNWLYIKSNSTQLVVYTMILML